MIEIEFDPAKDAINRQKHGIVLALGAVILRGRHVRYRSLLPNDSDEERWLAVGRIEGRILCRCLSRDQSSRCEGEGKEGL